MIERAAERMMPLRGRRATPATIPPSPALLTGLAAPQALFPSCHDLHKMCAIGQANPGQTRPASREKPRRESGLPDPAGFIRPASPEAYPIAGNLEETSSYQAHNQPVFPWITESRRTGAIRDLIADPAWPFASIWTQARPTDAGYRSLNHIFPHHWQDMARSLRFVYAGANDSSQLTTSRLKSSFPATGPTWSGGTLHPLLCRPGISRSRTILTTHFQCGGCGSKHMSCV